MSIRLLDCKSDTYINLLIHDLTIWTDPRI